MTAVTAARWCFVLPPDGAARNVAQKAADALTKKAGYDSVKCFDTHTYLTAFSRLLKIPDETIAVDLLNQSLIVTCLDFGATHLVSGALSPVTLFTLNILRKQGLCTVHWFYEDYLRVSYWKDILSGYDHFCAIQKGYLPRECKKAGSSFHYLPTAATFLPAENRHTGNDRYDIAFIGIPSSYRIQILEALHDSGFSLAIAGSGWNTYHGPLDSMIVSRKWVDDSITESILSQSTIGLNLSVDDPSGKEDVHISPRVYDILACGTALLTEEVPLIHDSLPECTFSTFRSITSVCSTARVLLSDRETISSNAENNRILIQNNHTYANRIEQLLSFVT